MVRIRNLKPQFWDSPSTAAADLAARLLFQSMWNWADDSGRGTANLKELEAFAFPNDEVAELPRRCRGNSAHGSGRWESFAEICGEVQQHYGVIFYEVAGRPYFYIPSFKDHQSKNFRPNSQLPSHEDGQIVDITGQNPPSDTFPPPWWPGASAHSAGNSAHSGGTLPPDKDRDRDKDRDKDDSAADAAGGTRQAGTAAPGPVDQQPLDGQLLPDPPAPAPSPEDTAGSHAQAIIGQWIEAKSQRPPQRVIGKLAKEVKTLLVEGFPPAQVLAAVQYWDTKGLDASLLSSVLHEMSSAGPRTRGSSERLVAGAALMAKVQARTQQGEPPAIGQILGGEPA